jgi:hypothetical protein
MCAFLLHYIVVYNNVPQFHLELGVRLVPMSKGEALAGSAYLEKFA